MRKHFKCVQVVLHIFLILIHLLGAGKTTTFNMLTGDTRPSSGTALIAGHDITTDIREVGVMWV